MIRSEYAANVLMSTSTAATWQRPAPVRAQRGKASNNMLAAVVCVLLIVAGIILIVHSIN